MNTPTRAVQRRAEHGSALVELMVATAVGLSLAALLGHTVTVFQAGYRHAATKVGGDQQARAALSLMADELGALLGGPTSASCPGRGVWITPSRLEFAANLYDRTTLLREPVSAGGREVAVESGGLFEAGDLVMIVDVETAFDPGDDVAECVRIAAVSTGRWTLDRALPRAMPAASPVALVNRVVYSLDSRRRLMRNQDGGSQRVAQDVDTFDARIENALVILKLGVHDAPLWTRRIALGDTR